MNFKTILMPKMILATFLSQKKLFLSYILSFRLTSFFKRNLSERYSAHIEALTNEKKVVFISSNILLDDYISKIRIACSILPERAVIQTHYSRNISLGPTLYVLYVHGVTFKLLKVSQRIKKNLHAL